MIHPVLTLLVAGAVQSSPDFQARDFQQIVLQVTEAVATARPETASAAREVTLCDIPFYYDALFPVPTPRAPVLVTYDWRSPVVFDLP